MSTRAVAEAHRRPSACKRILVGRAFASAQLEHTLLPKVLALPVFASDALSSVAYATGEILHPARDRERRPLKRLVIPISIAIAALMAIVIVSYRQTVRAYPTGGGAYIVSKDNLGRGPGLIAAAALLVDYMMTVVVSIVAGVFAIASAYPLGQRPQGAACRSSSSCFVTIANLRGARESGTLFAIPTYGFIVAIFAMIGVGLSECLGGCPPRRRRRADPQRRRPRPAPSGCSLILHAFSSGSTALTGVEAISNGVPAFRRPQAQERRRDARDHGRDRDHDVPRDLVARDAHRRRSSASDERSVVAQIANAVFGGGFGFYVVQVFTAAILILAANTAYQDFPRLSSILARDRYMPRQFVNRGDRLVFSNGVIVLAVVSCLMIYAFDADLTRLIQLYVVGVFTSFTLSQTGMVVHWLARAAQGHRRAARGWRRAIVINAVGAVDDRSWSWSWSRSRSSPHGALALDPVHGHPRAGCSVSIHRHYHGGRRGSCGATRCGRERRERTTWCSWSDELDAADRRGPRRTCGRSVRPSSASCTRSDRRDDPARAAGALAHVLGGRVAARAASLGEDACWTRMRGVRRAGSTAAPDDFVNVVIPEMVRGRPARATCVRRRDLVRLKAGLLREPNVVVTDVPVVVAEDEPTADVDARPLIPAADRRARVRLGRERRHDPRGELRRRRSEATETRAIYFELDPEEAQRDRRSEWFEARMRDPARHRRGAVPRPDRADAGGGAPVHAPPGHGRDRGRCPSSSCRSWWHLLLHNQNALFVKRLLLFEPNVILSSVPYVLEDQRQPEAVPAG